jgi:amino acid permease
MPLGTQVVWLFILALPIASVSWTITHEEVFREAREKLNEQSKTSQTLFRRKFYYVWTCEYCFSHYATVFFLMLTRYKLLFYDWRGYLIAFFALPYIANLYMGLYAQTKAGAKKDRLEAKVVQHEAEIKQIEKEEREAHAASTIKRPAA